jgi:hypothetical protein
MQLGDALAVTQTCLTAVTAARVDPIQMHHPCTPFTIELFTG